MKLYIYKNNLCDPVRNIGVARLFNKGKDIDEYIRLFVASIKPRYLTQYRAFIANDEVEFIDIDHYVLMGESIRTLVGAPKFQEIDLFDAALEVNTQLKAIEKRHRKARKAAEDKLAEKVHENLELVAADGSGEQERK